MTFYRPIISNKNVKGITNCSYSVCHRHSISFNNQYQKPMRLLLYLIHLLANSPS